MEDLGNDYKVNVNKKNLHPNIKNATKQSSFKICKKKIWITKNKEYHMKKCPGNEFAKAFIYAIRLEL